jgi:hypothetical protein
MKKTFLKKKSPINENIYIPQELANQYLTVKKQISDKQSKKDQLMKSVNQIDSEINILNRNILAIETKAAQMQGKEMQKPQQDDKKTTIEIEGQVKESIDLDTLWEKYISEDRDEYDEDDGYEEDIEDEYEDEEYEIDPDVLDALGDDSLDGDYVFSVRITDENEEEDIIAKFYRDEDDDFWKARVVQGSEDPIENMQFDPEMDKIDIIENLATIYNDVMELDIDEYEELLDDKETIDDMIYDELDEE